ncbi:MAG: sulfotransferase [Myxococcota bacterium]|nr:sulfotransferase [Myxococcota bacterium]
MSDPLATARALFAQRKLQEAAEALTPLLATETPPSGAWHLAALCAEAMGDLEALPALIQASHDAGVVDPNLLVRLSCYAGEPTPQGDGEPLLYALAKGVPLTSEPREPIDIDALVRNLVNLGQIAIVESLHSARAHAIAPQMAQQVEAVLTHMEAELPDAAPWVFIGGCPRSGTTLFRAMLNAHSRFHAGPETKVIRDLCAMHARWDRTATHQAGVTTQHLDRATKAFIDSLMADWGSGAPRVAEKTPGNLLHMKTLARIFPRGRFIHVIRDGRAVVNSLMKVNWSDPQSGESVWYCESVENAARYWAANIQQIRQQDPGDGRYLEVRYEDLVHQPEATMRRVLAWLNEPWEPAVLEHHLAKQDFPLGETSSLEAAQPIYRSANLTWTQTLEPQDLDAIERQAGPMLRELGYQEQAPSTGVVSLESLGLGF